MDQGRSARLHFMIECEVVAVVGEYAMYWNQTIMSGNDMELAGEMTVRLESRGWYH